MNPLPRKSRRKRGEGGHRLRVVLAVSVCMAALGVVLASTDGPLGSNAQAAAAQEAPPCNALLQLLNACPKPPTTTAPPTTQPGAPVAPPCNALLQLLNACPKPPTTTAPPTTVPGTTPPTTTAPGPGCGGVTSLPKDGGGTWSCVWQDEFNGTQLDRTKWLPQKTEGSGFDSNDHDCFMDSPNNINVSGGHLTLTSREEPAPFTCKDPKGARQTKYTSASVSTFGLFGINKGRVEWRARVTGAKQQGLHEALWLFPMDLNGGPGRGEIDVVEIYHTYPDRGIPYIHWIGSASDPQKTAYDCFLDPHEWNVFTMEWTAKSIKIWYNGKLCINNTQAPLNSRFNTSYMLAMSQMLGWPGNDFQPGVTPLPASLVVDYVRVWQ